MGNPKYYTKESIDASIKSIKDDELSNKIASLELIRMMSKDKSLKGEIIFYTAILEAIFREEKISYAEKEEFLILHKALKETYMDLKKG